jgi:hypothetical protein
MHIRYDQNVGLATSALAAARTCVAVASEEATDELKHVSNILRLVNNKMVRSSAYSQKMRGQLVDFRLVDFQLQEEPAT